MSLGILNEINSIFTLTAKKTLTKTTKAIGIITNDKKSSMQYGFCINEQTVPIEKFEQLWYWQVSIAYQRKAQNH